MSYTPDILIQKESFLKAFQEKFFGVMPGCVTTEQIIKCEVRKSVIRKKEFRGLKQLIKKRDTIKEGTRFGVDKTLGLSDKEKEIIIEQRLTNNKDYDEITKQINKLEKQLLEKVENSIDYVTWKELRGIVERDSTVTIEGKEYYWVITELSSVAHSLCDWLEENNVVYIPSYGR